MKNILITIAAVLLVGCGESQQSQPEPKVEAMKANLLKGKWIEFGDTVRDGPETWEFHENGTVDIIDEGKKMAGKYEVIPPDTVSMTAFGTTISAKISKSGDEITSAFGKYKKEGNHQTESKSVEPVAEAVKPEPPTAKAPDISIHEAAWNGNIEAVKQHIAAGTDLNAKDELVGRTPLHWAATNNVRREIVELLIANGADVNAMDSMAGMTPLHHATMDGYKEIAEEFIANGANVNAKTNDGKTPLDMAIFYNYSKTADLLRKHGGKTRTPHISIHGAASEGNIEAVKQHLTAGTDVNEKNRDGRTALHLAAFISGTDAIEVRKIAKHNRASAWINIPVEKTKRKKVISGKIEVVKLLLENGAKINTRARVNSGETPLDRTYPEIDLYAKYFNNKHRKYNQSVKNAAKDLIYGRETVANILRKHGGKTGEELKAEGK